MKILRTFRYRTAAQSRAPGYLARRMKAYARLLRMRERHQVIPIKGAKHG